MRRPPLSIHLMGAWTNSRLLDTATPFTQQNNGKRTFSGFVVLGLGGSLGAEGTIRTQCAKWTNSGFVGPGVRPWNQ